MKNSLMGRVLLALGFLILTALFSWQVFAAEAKIIDVKTSIPLSESETRYKDYYIYGDVSGFKPNSFVKVLRKTTVKDNKLGQNIAELESAVATLKIIQQKGLLAIAREHKVISRDNEPVLDQPGALIGDTVVSTAAVIEKETKKTSENNPQSTTTADNNHE